MFRASRASAILPAQRRCLFYQLHHRLYLNFTIFPTAILHLLPC